MGARRKRKHGPAQDLAASFSDGGTPETRAQGHAERFYSGTGEERWRTTVQVRIDLLRALKIITHREFEAGNRLRNDHHLAGMCPRVCGNPDSTGGSGRVWGEFSERQLAARERFNKALGALTASQSEVLIWVVLHDATLDYVGARRGGISARARRRVGGEFVREALSLLADTYGLPED